MDQLPDEKAETGIRHAALVQGPAGHGQTTLRCSQAWVTPMPLPHRTSSTLAFSLQPRLRSTCGDG